MKPNTFLNSVPNFKFTIEGFVGCKYETDSDSIKNASSYSAFICRVLVSVKSSQ